MAFTSSLPRRPCSIACIAALVGLFVGCATSSFRRREAMDAADFSLVLLVSAPEGERPTEALSERQFVFMEKLASRGQLLLAGAFGPDKHRDELRGIFLLDEPDAARAAALLREDPAAKAGVIRQEVIPIVTLDVIRTLPDVEKRRQELRLAAGEDMDRPDIRAYTVLIAPEGSPVAKEVFSNPAIGEVVVLMARMGAPREDELFAILDVPTASEARARLKVANTKGFTIHVSEWYSSPALAELAQSGGAPARHPPPPRQISLERAVRRESPH